VKHWSEQFLTVRWCLGGRHIETGLDCWGLLLVVQRLVFNRYIRDYDTVRNFLGDKLNTNIFKPEVASGRWNLVDCDDDLVDGDVVAMGYGPKDVHHVGTVCGKHFILHIEQNSCVKLETMRELRRKGWRTLLFYRYDSRSAP
jgi:cell wall-associated NlpC family hydrolase